MRNQLKRAWTVIKGFIPSKLPETKEAMEKWILDVLELAEMPMSDEAAVMLAGQIMHTKQDVLYIPKYIFAREIRRSLVNAMAYSIIDNHKRKQKEAREQSEKAAAEVVPEA